MNNFVLMAFKSFRAASRFIFIYKSSLLWHWFLTARQGKPEGFAMEIARRTSTEIELKCNEDKNKRTSNRTGHQNWLIINKEKNNVGKWQKSQLQSFRTQKFILFVFASSRFCFTVFPIYSFLLFFFLPLVDCVSMGIIEHAPQSVLVRCAVMKVKWERSRIFHVLRETFCGRILEEIRKSLIVVKAARASETKKLEG